MLFPSSKASIDSPEREEFLHGSHNISRIIQTKDPASEVKNSLEWHRACEIIGQLCLLAGSPSVTCQPDVDIAYLR